MGQRSARATAAVEGMRPDACTTKQSAPVHSSSCLGGRSSCTSRTGSIDHRPSRNMRTTQATTAEASKVQIPAQDSSYRSSNGDWLADEVVKRHAEEERRVLQHRLLQTTMSQEFSFFLSIYLLFPPRLLKKLVFSSVAKLSRSTFLFPFFLVFSSSSFEPPIAVSTAAAGRHGVRPRPCTTACESAMATGQEWPQVVNPPSLYQKNSVLPVGRGKSSGLARNAEYDDKAMLAQSRRHRQHARRGKGGAPGLAAPSSKSSDDILQRKRLALSPVTIPRATTFSSVASAFDFQHHLGSDPASELLVLKNILARESLLSRLENVCDLLRKRSQHPAGSFEGGKVSPREGAGMVVGLLSSMRDATVRVIEAVAVWRKDMIGHPPSAFVWHGDNYLLKITNDLNFLAGVQTLVDTLKV